MAFFLKRYSMRKHLAALRIFNYAQGCRKKLLSVDIPLGVHRPLGVPTPVEKVFPTLVEVEKILNSSALECFRMKYFH